MTTTPAQAESAVTGRQGNGERGMDERTGTPALNKALAAVQAELPKVGKGQEGKVEGQNKDGRRYSYSYKYADLADLSEAILPLLGQHGLCFTARPGLNDKGQFGLAYSLRHESGEQDDGFYPITPGTAQQNGSAITYARRYCLGAVTGIAPAEDDDGAAAQQARHEAPRSAGDAWERSTPASPRGQQANGHGEPAGDMWESAEPAAPREPRAQPPSAPADDPVIGTWAAKLDEITSAEDGDRVLTELNQAHSGGLLDSRRANAIRRAIQGKVAGLNGGHQGPQRPTGPAAGQRGATPVPAGKGDDGEWVRGWTQRLAKAASEDDLAELQRQVGPAVSSKTISPAKSADLSKAIRERRKELQEVPA